MTTTNARAVATKCLEAWTSGDLETTRSLLDSDVTFNGPLGHTQGIDDYMDGIERMAKVVERADQVKVLDEGDEDVCIIYHLVTSTPQATIPTAGLYEVHNGKITSVRAYFDPRPLLPN